MATTLSRLVTGLKYSSILAKTAVMHNWNEAASRRYLLDSLGSMPGISAKAAQFLAMKLGEGHTPDPLRLQPMPIEWIKSCIEKSSPRLHEELLELSDRPMVASLGQVHEGRLKSGENVAIKVQYPDLMQGFDTQLSLLNKVSKAGPPKKFQFEMESILHYFSQSLLRELDYRQEAQNQIKAAANLPVGRAIAIAKVYSEYSCNTILVQSFEPSSSLARVKEWWPETARRECAGLLLDYFLHAIFASRLVHTDPHPGNLGFRNVQGGSEGRNFELVLYDFGSMMTLESYQVSVLWQMIQAYQKKIDIVPFDYLVALGFDAKKLLTTSQQLPCLMERLLEPFCHEGAFNFKNWDLKGHFERVLGEDRWWFRSAGPPWFLMLMRAAQGLMHAIGELRAPIKVKQGLENLKLQVPPVEVPALLSVFTSEEMASTQAMAKKLLIFVNDEHGESIVRLELPSRAIDDLEDLIPEDTAARMKEKQIDLLAIKSRAQRSGYLPQVLFETKTQHRSYQVLLK